MRSTCADGTARQSRPRWPAKQLALLLAAALAGITGAAPAACAAGEGPAIGEAAAPAPPPGVPAGMTQPGRPEVTMAAYVFGMLRRGPNAPPPGTEPTEAAKQLQAAHMGHLESMWKQGKLVGAGPMLQEGDLRGILIFSGVSPDEAKALAEQDPKVKAGVLQVEVHPWMAAAGIGAVYNERAARGERPSMITLYLGFLRAGQAHEQLESAAKAKLQEAHLANIARLGREGKLPLAGPFLDDGPLRGLFVFRAASLDEAKALAAADPMVQSHYLELELLPVMVADGVVPADPPVPAEARN